MKGLAELCRWQTGAADLLVQSLQPTQVSGFATRFSQIKGQVFGQLLRRPEFLTLKSGDAPAAVPEQLVQALLDASACESEGSARIDAVLEDVETSILLALNSMFCALSQAAVEVLRGEHRTTILPGAAQVQNDLFNDA